MLTRLVFCLIILTHEIIGHDNLTPGLREKMTQVNCTNGSTEINSALDDNTSSNSSMCSSSSDFFPVEFADHEVQHKSDTTNISLESRILIFPSVPKGKTIRIYTMELPKESTLLYMLSRMMEYLHQDEFPLGLLKLVVKTPLSINIIIFQFLKMEWISLIWICLWGLLTFCLPLSLMIHLCFPVTRLQRISDNISMISLNNNKKWFKRILDCCLHLLLVILFSTAVITLFANEEISTSVNDAPSFVDIVMEDSISFLENTQTQISFVFNSSTNIGIDAVSKDLDDMEDLLGRPFQRELALETGVDVALTALEELQNVVWKVGALASDLLKDCSSARNSEIFLQEKLNTLTRQLTLARYQCFPKDRNLCDTLQPVGFEVNFFATNMTTDFKLKELQRMGSEDTLNSTIKDAIDKFKNIPQHVQQQSTAAAKKIKWILDHHLSAMSTALLEDRSKTWSSALNLTKHILSDTLNAVSSQEIYRWLAIICTSLGIILTWILFLCGAPCCCNYVPRTTGLLTFGLLISCFVCLLLWITGSFTFLLGTNGHTLLCQPLYNFTTLGNILDPKGILYGKGMLQGFAVGSENIRIQQVLHNCQRNRTFYRTFRLNDTLALNKTDHRTWSDLSEAFRKFSFNVDLQILNPVLQSELHDLSYALTTNLSKHRTFFLGPVTKRDLNSFEDQLRTVSRRLSDRASVKRIEDLAYETEEIIADGVKPLEVIRDSILYKITALEILLAPLNKELNQTMSHLKTIQYYFDNQGNVIAKKNVKQYLRRLESYLSQMHSYISQEIEKEVGKCYTVWKIFDNFRYYTCSLVVDPMNALSFCLFFCICLLFLSAYLAIKIIDYYKQVQRSGRITEREIWASPPSICSITAPVHTEEWTNPSPSLRENSEEHLIPPAPTPPPLLFPTSQSVLDTVKSRAKTPSRGRFESLKLIQPISWKRSLSPRNWI